MARLLTPGQATREVSEILGNAGMLDVRDVSSANLRTDPPQVRTDVRLMPWDTLAGAQRRADLLQALPGTREIEVKPTRVTVYRVPLVELRLSGAAVAALADRGHLPGYPGEVAGSGDEAELTDAAVRWINGAARTRVGRGVVFLGQASTADAARIMTYLEQAAADMIASGDANTRGDGRAVGRAVDFAAEHARRQGATVTENRLQYKIEV